MIDVQAKIHDHYTIEFKVGYITQPNIPTNKFVMNTWVFIPDSLDVNHRTFSKKTFYRDVRSTMRLITPVYQLRDLIKADNLPFILLQTTCKNATFNSSPKNLAEFESQIKMYASISKSAIRNAYVWICHNEEEKDILPLCQEIIFNITNLLKQYRSLYCLVNQPNTPLALEYFNYANEFISNVTEQHLFLLSDFLKKDHPDIFKTIYLHLFKLLDSELKYKQQMHYLYVDQSDNENNQQFVHHASLLKKYIESDLYLAARKRRNTFLLEQAAFSLAAGISMIFATTIAFSFQQTFGNFTMPFFVALVISYMLKDRIKELIRFYFAHKLGNKFFDNKITMSTHRKKIGWSKEGFDYITADKLPHHVREKRDRTALLETGRGIDEQIMLYRKKVHLEWTNINKINSYPLLGVNDIVRFNISEFMRKMDNSDVPVYSNLGNTEYEKIKANKVYYINYIIQCCYQGISEYNRYRITVDQKGIRQIDAITQNENETK
jgi:hypothetical protein